MKLIRNFIRYQLSFFRKNSAQKLKNQIEKPFVFIIPAYNCKQWYKKNLDSVFCQYYSNWRAIYIDDNSSDGTAALVKEYLQKKDIQNKVTFIQNTQRFYALNNIYHAIHSCLDHEIIVLLDGDDWLAHKNVLMILNTAYQDNNIWLTYGNYIAQPGKWKSICRRISKDEIEANKYRDMEWCTSHLRTFYSWLFKLIKKEDLLIENTFFKVAWDFAIMFPLLEMAAGRFKFIPEILYIYNIANPLNDGTMHYNLQQQMANLIRSKKKYSGLVTNLNSNF